MQAARVHLVVAARLNRSTRTYPRDTQAISSALIAP
jgi:hypothetical protein